MKKEHHELLRQLEEEWESLPEKERIRINNEIEKMIRKLLIENREVDEHSGRDKP